jgi:hypothetical protein
MENLYREKLTLYRLFLTFGLTAFSGCVAWFFVNVETVKYWQKVGSLSGIILIILLICFIIYRIRINLNKLKECL